MSSTHIVDDKPGLDELMHYGVKGMRWGQRMAEYSANRQRLRTLNKESKAKDRAERDASIDKARAETLNSRKYYLDAKAQYKVDKKTIGRREAKKKLNAVKQKNIDNAELAQQAKSGKESALAVLGLVGGVALVSLSGALRNS